MQDKRIVPTLSAIEKSITTMRHKKLTLLIELMQQIDEVGITIERLQKYSYDNEIATYTSLCRQFYSDLTKKLHSELESLLPNL